MANTFSIAVVLAIFYRLSNEAPLWDTDRPSTNDGTGGKGIYLHPDGIASLATSEDHIDRSFHMRSVVDGSSNNTLLGSNSRKLNGANITSQHTSEESESEIKNADIDKGDMHNLLNKNIFSRIHRAASQVSPNKYIYSENKINESQTVGAKGSTIIELETASQPQVSNNISLSVTASNTLPNVGAISIESSRELNHTTHKTLTDANEKYTETKDEEGVTAFKTLTPLVKKLRPELENILGEDDIQQYGNIKTGQNWEKASVISGLKHLFKRSDFKSSTNNEKSQRMALIEAQGKNNATTDEVVTAFKSLISPSRRKCKEATEEDNRDSNSLGNEDIFEKGTEFVALKKRNVFPGGASKLKESDDVGNDNVYRPLVKKRTDFDLPYPGLSNNFLDVDQDELQAHGADSKPVKYVGSDFVNDIKEKQGNIPANLNAVHIDHHVKSETHRPSNEDNIKEIMDKPMNGKFYKFAGFDPPPPKVGALVRKRRKATLEKSSTFSNIGATGVNSGSSRNQLNKNTQKPMPAALLKKLEESQNIFRADDIHLNEIKSGRNRVKASVLSDIRHLFEKSNIRSSPDSEKTQRMTLTEANEKDTANRDEGVTAFKSLISQSQRNDKEHDKDSNLSENKDNSEKGTKFATLKQKDIHSGERPILEESGDVIRDNEYRSLVKKSTNLETPNFDLSNVLLNVDQGESQTYRVDHKPAKHFGHKFANDIEDQQGNIPAQLNAVISKTNEDDIEKTLSKLDNTKVYKIASFDTLPVKDDLDFMTLYGMKDTDHTDEKSNDVFKQVESDISDLDNDWGNQNELLKKYSHPDLDDIFTKLYYEIFDIDENRDNSHREDDNKKDKDWVFSNSSLNADDKKNEDQIMMFKNGGQDDMQIDYDRIKECNNKGVIACQKMLHGKLVKVNEDVPNQDHDMSNFNGLNFASLKSVNGLNGSIDSNDEKDGKISSYIAQKCFENIMENKALSVNNDLGYKMNCTDTSLENSIKRNKNGNLQAMSVDNPDSANISRGSHDDENLNLESKEILLNPKRKFSETVSDDTSKENMAVNKDTNASKKDHTSHISISVNGQFQHGLKSSGLENNNRSFEIMNVDDYVSANVLHGSFNDEKSNLNHEEDSMDAKQKFSVTGSDVTFNEDANTDDKDHISHISILVNDHFQHGVKNSGLENGNNQNNNIGFEVKNADDSDSANVSLEPHDDEILILDSKDFMNAEQKFPETVSDDFFKKNMAVNGNANTDDKDHISHVSISVNGHFRHGPNSLGLGDLQSVKRHENSENADSNFQDEQDDSSLSKENGQSISFETKCQTRVGQMSSDATPCFKNNLHENVPTTNTEAQQNDNVGGEILVIDKKDAEIVTPKSVIIVFQDGSTTSKEFGIILGHITS